MSLSISTAESPTRCTTLRPAGGITTTPNTRNLPHRWSASWTIRAKNGCWLRNGTSSNWQITRMYWPLCKSARGQAINATQFWNGAARACWKPSYRHPSTWFPKYGCWNLWHPIFSTKSAENVENTTPQSEKLATYAKPDDALSYPHGSASGLRLPPPAW